MDGKQLFIHNGSVYQKVNAFVCGNCSMSNRTMEGAEQCCRCTDCKDKPCLPMKCRCTACQAVFDINLAHESAKQEKAAFDAATEATEWEHVWYNDKMYTSVEEMLEDLATYDVAMQDLPEFVFAMKPVKFSRFSLDYLIEDANEGMCEDVYVEEILKGLDELKQAFKDFNDLNKETVVYWEEDRTRKVRVVYDQG